MIRGGEASQRTVPGIASKPNKLSDVQSRRDRSLLRQIGDLAREGTRAKLFNRSSGIKDFADARLNLTGKELEERGLSLSVMPDDAIDAPAF